MFKRVILFLIFSTALFPQIEDDKFETALENIFDQNENVQDQINFSEFLNESKNNLQDLNSISINDLLRFPQMDYSSALRIIEYRNSTGKFLSINEIDVVNGLDDELRSLIKEYFFVDSKVSYKGKEKIQLNLQSSLIDDFERSSNSFVGSNLHLINKYKMNYGNKILFSAVTDKDKGEKSIIDHYSLGLQVNNILFVDKLVIGDYSNSFGQGLVIGNNFIQSKGANVIFSSKLHLDGLRMSASTNETNFFRGISSIIQFSSFQVQPFFSSSYFDSNYDSTRLFISSIRNDGYHRTESEISKKNNEQLRIVGTIFRYVKPSLEISFLYTNLSYSKELRSEYLFGIRGKNFNFYSMSYDFLLDKFNFFGELALSQNKSYSLYSGIIGELSKNILFTSSIRNYSKDFVSPLSNSFGEFGNKAQNEIGFFNGFNIKFSLSEVNFFFDIFKNYFPSASDLSSKNGRDLLIEFNTKEIQDIELIFRYRNRSRYDEKTFENLGEKSKPTVLENSNNLRFEITKKFSPSLFLKWRIEYLDLSFSDFKDREKGLMTFLEIKTKLNKNISLKSRFILFQTASYDSRIYEFESNIKNYMYTQSLYGKGIRWYVLVNYDILNYLKLSLKYSETLKNSVIYVDENNKLDILPSEKALFFQIEIKL